MNITKHSYVYFSSRDKIVRVVQILSILSLSLTISCSHLKPYYRGGRQIDEKPHIPVEMIKHRILLIGDAGTLNESRTEPTLESLFRAANTLPDKTTIIFLGDNVYNNGLPSEEAEEREKKEKILKKQLDRFKNGNGSHAAGVMIPGNHDWDDGREKGLEAIKRESGYVRQNYGPTVQFLPANAGCPGPDALDLDMVRIIFLDTHWWLHKHAVETEGCDPSTPDSNYDFVSAYAFTRLKELVETAGDREVIVTAHHPLETKGPHGGFFTWRDHIFPLTNLVKFAYLPLPLVGSIYPLIRWNVFRHNQDLGSRAYASLVDSLRSALTVENDKRKPLLYAAGHDHSLQVLQGNTARFSVVSGSTAKSSAVSHDSKTIFAHQHTGFVEVDFLADGRVYLTVIEPEGDGTRSRVVFSKQIKEKNGTRSMR